MVEKVERLKGQQLLASQDNNAKKELYIDRIENFIHNQVKQRELDERTIKAYRLDLLHFEQWLREANMEVPNGISVESYLEYLTKEKKLRYSTVTRKYRVICYYMEYLFQQGQIANYERIRLPDQKGFIIPDKKSEAVLTKSEIDSLFTALNREYKNLDSEFRKRVCLRDSVMIKILFYHQLEISELLRLKISDYNRKTNILTVHKKREENMEIYLFSQELKQQVQDFLQEHEYFEHEELYQNYLFLSKLGKPLSMKMMINIFDKYRVMAGIKQNFTPKNLKNSIARYGLQLIMEQCG